MKHSQIHHSGRQEKKMHFILILKPAGSNAIALFSKNKPLGQENSKLQTEFAIYYVLYTKIESQGFL